MTVKRDSHLGCQFLRKEKHHLWHPMASCSQEPLVNIYNRHCPRPRGGRPSHKAQRKMGAHYSDPPIGHGCLSCAISPVGSGVQFFSHVEGQVLVTRICGTGPAKGSHLLWRRCVHCPATAWGLEGSATVFPEAFFLVCVVWILVQISRWCDSLVNLLGALVKVSLLKRLI